MMNRRLIDPLFFYVFVLCLIFAGSLAFAKTTWEFHKSITSSFDVRFPADYKIKSIPLRIDANTVLFRTEIMANVGEGEDEKNNVKSFFVKVDQSMGGSLVTSKVKKLLKRDEYKYKKSARSSGGQLVSVNDVNISGFIGKEFYITYQDGVKKQGMRAKVMYTDISRVEMVLTGPAESMYAFKSNDFFDSVKLYDGPGKIGGKIGDGWKDYESPLGLFTVVTPPETNTYALGAPKFFSEGNKEKGRYVFRDPILGYKTFYNFYGYKIREEKTYDDIKTLLYTEHVARYSSLIRITDLKIDNSKSENGEYGIVSTRIKMPPLHDYPHINSVLLQAIFNKDGVVVLEFLGSSSYVDTPLAKTMFSLVKFHPEKAYEPREAKDGQSLNPSVDAQDPFEGRAEEESEEEEIILDDPEDHESPSPPASGDQKADAPGSGDKVIEEDKQTLKATIVLGEPASTSETPPDEAQPADVRPQTTPVSEAKPLETNAPAVKPEDAKPIAPQTPEGAEQKTSP